MLPWEPEKVALPGVGILPVTRRTPVPVKVGDVASYTPSPVLTDTLLPFVGNTPALNSIVSVSLATDVVRLGSAPTAVILLTIVVEPPVFNEIVGAVTVPLGVYVVVPELA